MSTTADHPGDQPGDDPRAHRRDRRHDPVQERPPVGGVARLGPAGTLHRRSTTAPWDQCGDRYLRKLLVHGARATLRWVDTKGDDRSQWPKALIARRGKHPAAAQLATKK